MGMDIYGTIGAVSDAAASLANQLMAGQLNEPGLSARNCITSHEQIWSPVQIKKVGNAEKPGTEEPEQGAGESNNEYEQGRFGANCLGPTQRETNPYFAKMFGGDGETWIKESDFLMMENDGTTTRGGMDLNIRKTQRDISTVNVHGLRGPLILSGFGFDIADNPVPGMADDVFSIDETAPGDRRTWKTGPVNLMWDEERKVWQGGYHIVCGICIGGIEAPDNPCQPTEFDIKVLRLGNPADEDKGQTRGRLNVCELQEVITVTNRDPSLEESALAGQIFVVAVRINYEWIPIWVGCPEEPADGDNSCITCPPDDDDESDDPPPDSILPSDPGGGGGSPGIPEDDGGGPGPY